MKIGVCEGRWCLLRTDSKTIGSSRRIFITLLGGGATWLLAARVQQPRWLPPRRRTHDATVGRTVTLANALRGS